ncbi:hypothetical protein LELG_03010 [Lodderomyces elongisporus NRRL YB-4239]|uniref:Zn(2)-C6 fungal-type domain-containing protein n=1 Tax=Lodderomyces elongisporus (strain ATCC 11503 / CBS 2605 / JCM 1781 / NBRC 1676 / NRRL YB-4239) TaxID=379508 RepID=A5E073_LODEL|nr:hypothetical protein LELG_03010 [Lodderomyces elongisporus NRRL YB-4239]
MLLEDHHSYHTSNSGHVKKKRVGKACDSCRIKKTKCDGKKPCNRCLLDNKICVFTEKKKLKEKVHPPGYTELLETRLDLLSKLFEKLIDLAKPHLPEIEEVISKQKKNKSQRGGEVVLEEEEELEHEHENEQEQEHELKHEPEHKHKHKHEVEAEGDGGIFTDEDAENQAQQQQQQQHQHQHHHHNEHEYDLIPINQVIAYLIEKRGLLKNLPLEWEEGALIAANTDSTNMNTSSKLFAEHKYENASAGSSPKLRHSSVSSVSSKKIRVKQEPMSPNFSRTSSSEMPFQVNQNKFSLTSSSHEPPLSDLESDASNGNSDSISPPYLYGQPPMQPAASLFANNFTTSSKNSSMSSLNHRYEHHNLSNIGDSSSMSTSLTNNIMGNTPLFTPVLKRSPSSLTSFSQKLKTNSGNAINANGHIHKPQHHNKAPSIDTKRRNSSLSSPTSSVYNVLLSQPPSATMLFRDDFNRNYEPVEDALVMEGCSNFGNGIGVANANSNSNSNANSNTNNSSKNNNDGSSSNNGQIPFQNHFTGQHGEIFHDASGYYMNNSEAGGAPGANTAVGTGIGMGMNMSMGMGVSGLGAAGGIQTNGHAHYFDGLSGPYDPFINNNNAF